MMIQRRLTIFAMFLLASSAACNDSPPILSTSNVNVAPRAPLLAMNRAPVDSVARYIVALKNDVQNPDSRAHDLAARYGTARHQVFEHVFHGFAATMSPKAVAELRSVSDIAFVELDRIASAQSIDWGLDRIDQRYYPPNGMFSSAYTGSGVTIYIVDSGVQATHADFGSRVVAGINTGGGAGTSTNPCASHGTAVASIAAGARHGVATEATIVGVKGTDGCQEWGWVSDWSAAIDWVIGNHTSGPAVMNFSYGVDNWIDDAFPGSMNEAVKAAKLDGIFTVVSAGNKNADACGYSPANAMEVMTVAASAQIYTTGFSDVRASYSNYGDACVDIYAPGSSRWAAQMGGDSSLVSGTSFAAPTVAGVGALLLERYPSDSPDVIHYMIVGGATQGVISNSNGASSNRLLYSNLPTVPLVFIDGPSTVGVGNFGCEWSAVVAGGRQPFSYQWSGLRPGTASSITGPISGSGTFNLDVWDSAGGHGQASFYVTVDPNNPGDPLCTI